MCHRDTTHAKEKEVTIFLWRQN